MNKKISASVTLMLRQINEKRGRKEELTVREAMVLEYHRPCTRVFEKDLYAHKFGTGSLIIMSDEVVVVCADPSQEPNTDEFYPRSGLKRAAILQGTRYPAILAGSRLVRGKYLIQVCTQERLKDEKALARIINKWRDWVPKTTAPTAEESNPFKSK